MLLLFLQFDSECNARANLTQSSLLVLLRCSRVSPTVKSLSRDLKLKTRFQFPENSFLISGGKDAIKREQRQTRLSYAERKHFRSVIRIMLQRYDYFPIRLFHFLHHNFHFLLKSFVYSINNVYLRTQKVTI